MQEENALPEAPQRRGAELVSSRPALRNVVRQPGAHVMYFNVAEQIGRGVAQT